ncbi:MAG: hydrogenase maturation protease [Lutimonas sp.]
MSRERTIRTLVLGIGNSGRKDDGLGWEFIDFLKKQEIENLELDYRYQLQIEDAELISHYDRIIFVDATKEPTTDGFYLRPCSKKVLTEMNSHSLHPETVSSLCSSIYGRDPECFILGIEGNQWGLETGLSPEARKNLERAKRYLVAHLFVYL